MSNHPFIMNLSAITMNLYLELPTYLHQWLLHEFGDEHGIVHLPRGCAEHDVLELCLKKWPPREPVETMGPGKTPIAIPDLKSRPWEHYNYLNAHGKKLLIHVIHVRFRVQLWHDLSAFNKLHLPITDSIYDWMEAHGIEPEEKSWEAIRQIYFRQRKRYRKKKC